MQSGSGSEVSAEVSEMCGEAWRTPDQAGDAPTKQREGTSGVSLPMRFDGAYARFTPEKDRNCDPWEEGGVGK